MKVVSVLGFAWLGLAAAMPVAGHAAEVPEAVGKALVRALEDERHAEAYYAVVIAKFGDVQPFSKIIKAEQKHQARITGLLTQYGLPVPPAAAADPAVTAPGTLAEACKAAASAESANRDLYDKELLPAVAAYPDITKVFQRFRNVSDKRHLPAFQGCASS